MDRTDRNGRDGQECREPLIPKHGGYRRLKTFQLTQLIYDVTIRFCDRNISPRSRTHDQMVQAARSGVQNIAEGSQASGTSKKTELKLTNVARASLEELRLDYEDFFAAKGFADLESRRPAPDGVDRPEAGNRRCGCGVGKGSEEQRRKWTAWTEWTTEWTSKKVHVVHNVYSVHRFSFVHLS